MLQWRIYYGDDTTYSNQDGSPEATPKRDVQVIVQVDSEVGRVLLHRFDFYWWQDGQWYGGDYFGLVDYLIQPGWKIVLFGRSVPNSDYRALVTAASTDSDFPRKSAYAVGERR